MQLIMRRPEITNFLAVSPPVRNNTIFLSCRLVLFQRMPKETGQLVSEESVSELAKQIVKAEKYKIVYRVIGGADRFF